MKRFFRQIIFWSGLLASTGLAFAQTSKIAPDLQSLLSNLLGPVNVVVQYNSAPGPVQITQLLALGGTIAQQYSVIPGIAVTLPASVVDLLSLSPAVAYISLDRPVAGTLDLTTAASHADLAYQSGYTGAGVGIAIIDSGIYAHPDLASRIVYRQSFVQGHHPGRLWPWHPRGRYRRGKRSVVHRPSIHADLPRRRTRRSVNRSAGARCQWHVERQRGNRGHRPCHQS